MRVTVGTLKRLIREEHEYARALQELFDRSQNAHEGRQATHTKGKQARGADSYDRTR